MYSPVHAAVGLIIAKYMPDPVTAAAAGWASHYLLDAIPHGDSGVGDWMTKKNPGWRIAMVEILDLGLAALIVWAMLAGHQEYSSIKLIAGAIGGIMPDLIWGGAYLLERLNWRIPLITSVLAWHGRLVHRWHVKETRDLSLVNGMIFQALILGLIFLLRL